jgi:hypothetical protein
MKMDTIVLIEKEKISGLHFSSEDVCKNAHDHSKRDQDLLRAQSLGNLLKNKVHITFKDADGQVYQVYTTVWAYGKDFVCLKADICLPVKAIIEVK